MRTAAAAVTAALALVGSALAAPATNAGAGIPSVKLHAKRQEPGGYVCQNMTIGIPLTQNVEKNYTQDNYDVQFFYDVQAFKVFRTATYNIAATYCAPPNNASGMVKDTVMLLNHGATFRKEMWDFPYQPEKYSWVRKMWANGYPTFAWDNIGCGESDHPDGLFEVQTQGIVEGNRYLSSLLKNGTIGGTRYKNVVYTGFSIGAVAGVSLASQYPDAVDAIILHGYSWNVKNLYPGYLAGLQQPVNQLEDRWANISALYQSQSTRQARQAVVFYGDFDPAVVPVDYELRDMDALGLALSFGYHLVPAPNYTGPVFLGDGNQDSSFCGEGCGSQPYAAYDNFPKASDLDIHVYNQSGHAIQQHNCAPQLQSDCLAFLQRNGF